MDLLQRVCHRTMADEGHEMEYWQWGQGVALYGLAQAYLATREEAYLSYLKHWMDSHMERGLPGYSVNTTAPLLTALELYRLTGEERYYALCKAFADWCIAQAPRSEKGALEHSCTENVYPNQIWADTLYMGALFLANFSKASGEALYMHEAMRQFVLHYAFLSDRETSLIVHGYYGNERIQRGMLWGRGNGWFSAASAMLLELADTGHPLYQTIADNWKTHCEALLRFQRADGGWNTVIDDPASYLETSGTAAFAFGLSKALEMGILPADARPAVEKAVSAVLEHIDETGALCCASGGTCVMETAAEYNQIPYAYSPFAQGLALMVLAMLQHNR